MCIVKKYLSAALAVGLLVRQTLRTVEDRIDSGRVEEGPASNNATIGNRPITTTRKRRS